MYISKKKACVYGAIILIVVLVAHAIMIINRADLMKKEQEMLTLSEKEYTCRSDVLLLADSEEADFFVEFRLEREKVRSHRIDILVSMLDNKDIALEIKNTAQKSLQTLLSLSELEMQVEALLLAKGFKDAVLCWQDNAVNVIIREEGLTPVRAVQIRDLVARSLSVDLEDVVVIEK